MNPSSHRITNLPDLDELQQWMCRAIRTPLSELGDVTPDPAYYLTPGEEISALERLEIYADDYWSRCINSLSEDFLGLEHVWGHKKFHSISEKYLVEHPSRSYSLRNLGDELLSFVQTSYQDADKDLVLDMIRFEWAKIEAFDNPARDPFDATRLTMGQKRNLASLSFVFQPHVTLLHLKYPVFDVVDGLLANAKEKEKVALPEKKECFTVVYRHDLPVFHKEIEKPHYLLLERLGRGLSLSAACDEILALLDKDQIKRLEKKAQQWFQDCVGLKWFCAP